MDTQQNQNTCQIDGLPAGYYRVVAYKAGCLASSYTLAVPCGLSVDCTDPTLIEVPVNIGQMATGVDPGDWYAPDGTFPSAPVLP